MYTPIRMRDDDGRTWGIRVKQWMVDNHEDYYQGCVMSVINKWRKTLGKAKVGLGSKGSFFGSAITLSLSLSDSKDDMLQMDAIKYMSEVIAERLGRMYGLQIYYYRKPLSRHPNRSDWLTGQAGISIAGPGHGVASFASLQCFVPWALGILTIFQSMQSRIAARTANRKAYFVFLVHFVFLCIGKSSRWSRGFMCGSYVSQRLTNIKKSKKVSVANQRLCSISAERNDFGCHLGCHIRLGRRSIEREGQQPSWKTRKEQM